MTTSSHVSNRCSSISCRKGYPPSHILAAALVILTCNGSVVLAGQTESDWSARRCPSEAAKAGDPLDPTSPTAMGPHSDIMEHPGTFCDLRDADILDRMRHRRVRECRFNSGGLSVSLRISLRGTEALFKPTQQKQHSVPRKEIVAYRLNRLLGLNRVPPAVTMTLSMSRFYRTIRDGPRLRNRKLSDVILYQKRQMRGELSWWIPHIRFLPLHLPSRRRIWTRWLTAYHAIPAESYDLAGQISKMLLFDFLMNNQDRFSGGNVITTRDGRRLYFMDNALSLFPEIHRAKRSRALRNFLSIHRLSRSLLSALAKLTRKALTTELAKEPNRCWKFLASDNELAAMMKRRDIVLNRTAELVVRYGWDEVMVFP